MLSHHTPSIKNATVLTLIVCMLTACSSSLLVRNLDWLLERYIDDYFDLSHSQSELLSELVDDSAQRSLADSIPALLGLIDKTIALNDSNTLASAVPELTASFEALGDHIMADNADNLLRFAMTITEEQRQQIAEELQHRNRKYIKKHIEPSEGSRRSDFAKDVRRYATRWLGQVSTEQEANLLNFTAQYRLNETEWMDSRKAWQNAFLDALALPSGPAKSQQLRTLIEEPEKSFSDRQRKESDFNTELSIQLLQSVIAASDERQRERIHKQLLKLRNRVSGFQQALG